MIGLSSMKDEDKARLQKILGDYEAKLAEAARIDAVNRAAQAAFPGRFVALAAEVLRPAMQEIADLLRARGHEATVHEQEESSSTAGGVKAAAVSMRVVPKSVTPGAASSSPVAFEISFSANRAERKVVVSSSSTMMNHGARMGKRGEFEVDAVTADVVATHAIKALEEAIGSTR